MNSKKDPNRYDEVDNRFVKDINKIEDAIGDQRVAGGKRVDEYVLEKGGIQYGDRTIESIVQHPDIQVCAGTLRRWWAYYRLYNQLGKEIAAKYPKARARDYYELSRILEAVILTKDGESQEDARKRTILEVADWLGQKRKNGRVSCAEVQAMVTRVADAGATDNNIEETDSSAVKPDRRSKVAKAISFAEIKDAVDYLVNFSDPKHLASGNINNTALCLEFNRLADSFVQLADHLSRAGHNAEVHDKLGFVRHKMDEIEAKLEPASVTWAGDSDTGVKIEGDYGI
jgi:hypothetical protein